MSAPIVFITYSHDTQTHKDWVYRLASDLRGLGIDVILDEWDLSPGQDTVAFMEQSVTRAERVVLICTENYIDRAEAPQGGVGYERLIVTHELVDRLDSKKFIPVVRQSIVPRRTLKFLGPRLFIDFSEDVNYLACVEQLARDIHGQPLHGKPPLGPNPYTSTAPAAPIVARIAGPTGLTPTGAPVLDDQWFKQHSEAANRGLTDRGRIGAMDLRLALHQPIGRSQLELLNAMRRSTIPTFGWPIGVLLENRTEFRPKPTQDGILAEVSISDRSLSGRTSYDYWTLRTNGDFFALQSFFEDERASNVLFFNTRIVRIAEAMLLSANIYDNLGIPGDALVSVSITHQGLRRRTLGSSTFNRDVLPRVSEEDRSESTLTASLASLRTDTTEHVMQIAAPLFMIFDFATFSSSVYEDIVSKFKRGHVT